MKLGVGVKVKTKYAMVPPEGMSMEQARVSLEKQGYEILDEGLSEFTVSVVEEIIDPSQCPPHILSKLEQAQCK